LLILDEEHKVVYANPAAATLTGFGDERMQGLDFLALVCSADREAVAHVLSRKGQAEVLDVTIVTHQGAEKEVELSVSNHVPTPGGMGGFVGLRDLSRPRALERAAWEAQEKARKIAELGDVGILIYDQDFRIEFANAVAAEIIGSPVEGLLGTEITRFLGRVNRIHLKGLYSPLHLDEHRRVRMEMPLQRPDGNTKMVEICLAMTRGGGGALKTYAYLRDLTERVRMENELRKTNEFLKNVIRSSVDGIIAADMRGNIILFNEGAERLLGHRAEDVIGKIHITQLYPPGVAKKIMRRLRSETYGPRGKLPTTPTTIVAKSGEHIPVRISAAIVYEGAQEIASVGIFRDLRERIKMQQQLEDTYKQLLHSEKLASLGKLAAGVAHEINNPLGGILMYANMMLEQARDEQTVKDLREIVDQTLRCKEIVQGLLDFARRRGEERAMAQIDAVLDKCIGLMSKQAFFMNIHVEREFQPDLPPVMADPDQLTQVFTNLIVNAADAMGGKGTLRLRTWGEGSPPQVHVEVSDTGAGIPDEHLSRIFDPFFTTKEVGKGTGLGLSIAYGIVKKRGGQIQVRSRVGEGTTFHLVFPQDPPAGQPMEMDAGVGGIRDREGRALQVALAGDKGLMRLLAFYEAFEPKGGFEGLPPPRKKERRRWVVGLVGGWRNFLILDGDQMIGHVAVTLGESDLEELIIFIHQDYRGKGVGSEALRHVCRLLEQEGCRTLWVTVESTNRAAIRCLEKVGFRVTSEGLQPEREMVLDLGE
jgi:PAS domain S-box-containing protein